jgi:hypothetical protein
MLLEPVAFTVADPDNVPDDSWLKVGEVSTDAGGYMFEIKNLNPGFYEAMHKVRVGEVGTANEEWQSGQPMRGEVKSNDPQEWDMLRQVQQAIHDRLMSSGDATLRQAVINGLKQQNPGLTDEEAENADFTSIEMPYGYGWLRGAVQQPLQDAKLTAGGSITVNHDWFTGITVSRGWFTSITGEHAEEAWGDPTIGTSGVIDQVTFTGLTNENTGRDWTLYCKVVDAGGGAFRVDIFRNSDYASEQVGTTGTASSVNTVVNVSEANGSGLGGTLRLNALDATKKTTVRYSKKLKLYGSIVESEYDSETYYDLVLYKDAAKLEEHIVGRFQNIVKETGVYGLRWRKDHSVASFPVDGMVQLDTLAARDDIVITLTEQRTDLFTEHYIRKVG